MCLWLLTGYCDSSYCVCAYILQESEERERLVLMHSDQAKVSPVYFENDFDVCFVESEFPSLLSAYLNFEGGISHAMQYH